jgi:hypothetical protein
VGIEHANPGPWVSHPLVNILNKKLQTLKLHWTRLTVTHHDSVYIVNNNLTWQIPHSIYLFFYLFTIYPTQQQISMLFANRNKISSMCFVPYQSIYSVTNQCLYHLGLASRKQIFSFSPPSLN